MTLLPPNIRNKIFTMVKPQLLLNKFKANINKFKEKLGTFRGLLLKGSYKNDQNRLFKERDYLKRLYGTIKLPPIPIYKPREQKRVSNIRR